MHQDGSRKCFGTLIGHGGLPAGAPVSLGVVVISSTFGARTKSTAGVALLPATRKNSADVAAVNVASVAAGAYEEEHLAATTTELDDIERATNWTRAGPAATLASLFCVFLTQVTALRPRAPTAASSFSPS